MPEKKARIWARLPLRTKLALLMEGLILVIVFLTGAITTIHERQSLEEELRNRGMALAGDLAGFAVRPLLSEDVATLRRYVRHSQSQEYVRYITILDAGRKVVMDTDLREIGTIRQDELSRRAASSSVPASDDIDLGRGGESIYHIYSPVQAGEARLGTVIMGYSHRAADEGIVRARRKILTVGLTTAVLGGILASLLAAYVTIPIRRITEAMKARAGEDADLASCLERKDEIGELAISFRQMTWDLSRHRESLEILVEARTEQLQEANDRLQQENAERTRAEEHLRQSQSQLRSLASHLQTVRERERTQIAREIHDELGQTLTALKMDLHWMRQRLHADQQPLADKAIAMSKLVDATVQAVRRISSELRPKLLDDLGLSAALEWQAQQFQERTGIPCDIRSEPDDIVLDQERTTAFFRIFQEALTNVTRHARATQVEALLTREDGQVGMTIRDNGRGITREEAAGTGSLGIVGMRERALGGKLKIDGAPRLGTTVEVTIPL